MLRNNILAFLLLATIEASLVAQEVIEIKDTITESDTVIQTTEGVEFIYL